MKNVDKRKVYIKKRRSKFGSIQNRFELLVLKTSVYLYIQIVPLFEKNSTVVSFRVRKKNTSIESLSEKVFSYFKKNKLTPESFVLNVANYRYCGLIKMFSENLNSKFYAK